MGLEKVPCVRLTHLSPDQKKGFAIADNKIGDLSSFDVDALRSQLKELAHVEFDMELTGFDTAEIDLLFDGPAANTSADPVDTFAEPDPSQTPVSQLGDLWLLEPHRLLCGSALDLTAYERLLGDDRAHLIFTDPPYNVPIQGHVSGLGRVKHREFAMASGEMSEGEYRSFLAAAMKHVKTFSSDGSIHALEDRVPLPEKRGGQFDIAATFVRSMERKQFARFRNPSAGALISISRRCHWTFGTVGPHHDPEHMVLVPVVMPLAMSLKFVSDVS